MKNYRIAVIAGDGIGKEVVPAGIEVLNLAAEQGGFRCEFTQIPWGCDYYLEHGRMMDEDGVDRLMKFDAIYLGAIGDPRVADHISARELIRRCASGSHSGSTCVRCGCYPASHRHSVAAARKTST